MKRPPSTAGRVSERGVSWDCERPRSELSKAVYSGSAYGGRDYEQPPCAKIQSWTRSKKIKAFSTFGGRRFPSFSFGIRATIAGPSLGHRSSPFSNGFASNGRQVDDS